MNSISLTLEKVKIYFWQDFDYGLRSIFTVLYAPIMFLRKVITKLVLKNHTRGADACWTVDVCSCEILRRLRLISTNCRKRSFCSSVRIRSSFMPSSKHRRKRHDEHRRICICSINFSFSFELFCKKIFISRCRHEIANN